MTIEVGKKDRIKLASAVSSGCASGCRQGKEGAKGHYGFEIRVP